jgi:hypothetical protein
MERSLWKDTRRHSDPAELQPPRYWPGDLVQEIGEPDEIAVVEFSRSDGQICLQWPSGRKEWLHTDVLEFAPGFTPKGRRNPTQESS